MTKKISYVSKITHAGPRILLNIPKQYHKEIEKFNGLYYKVTVTEIED